ncbi:MAG: parallel beta-helix domain-containing protein [Pirellulales bacterium]
MAIQTHFCNWLLGLSVALACFSSAAARAASDLQPGVYSIAPGPQAVFQLQARLIEAVAGDVIELAEGRYELRHSLDVVAGNVTIRGQGSGKTVLSFRGQVTGGHGIEATGNNFVIEGLAVEDTAGNAVKVRGARNVTFRDVRVEWTGAAEASNGAYGIYPVQCENVLIEDCTAIGASDAGLYVGQCRNVIVRNSRAERNVAGIEIENTVNADVYDNVATNNAGGILVFDLPGLPVKKGSNVRVFKNRVLANNHENFAAPGNIVASVPSGTGVMVLASDDVEIFDNDIENNDSFSVTIVSYLITGKRVEDAQFDPFPEAVSVHNNRISGGGKNPGGDFGKLLLPVLGKPFPDIMWDGVINERLLVDGKLPEDRGLRIADNGEATFVDFNFAALTPENLVTGRWKMNKDASIHAANLRPLPAVKLRPHDPPSAESNQAALVYRSAPRKLSEWGLFEGNGSTQQPVAGVVPYDLNTQLFSDYTSKHRFFRISKGTKIEYRDEGVLELPVGAVIAKTFAYPHDMRAPSQGEQLLETRIEMRDEDGWYGFSYQWNREQTEAHLVLGGSEVEANWVHADGKRRTLDYQVPSANQCLSCHAQDKKYEPLGPTAINMNRDHRYADGHANQLAYLVSRKMLAGAPEVEKIDRLAVFDDPHTGDVAARARAWLDVNCAHCHSPSGSGGTSGLDLRRVQTDPAKFGVWKTPIAAGHGSGGFDYDIVPGKPEESILMFRLQSEDPGVMMPNVARRLVPTEAAELIRQWIAEMN